MNVTELARKMKIPTKVLLENLPGWGFDIGKRAIKIDDRVAQKILMMWQGREIILKQEKKIDEEAEKVSVSKTQAPIEIGEKIVVSELAKRMSLPVTKLIAELMKNGVMATLNQEIDYETAAVIAEDMGFKIKKSEEKIEERGMQAAELKKIMEKEKKGKLKERPPVVVVMGHVDHGKTKLLDAIRKTNLVDKEAGGITQHIGAYQAEKNGQLITFLDTPGHEAFRAMRARGGKAADIAILVVAADDGVQPQTKEAIQIIQQENLPFVVAINKIDKSGADPERVKRELSDLGLAPEDWGGKTIMVPISAKQVQGIDDLLEMIILVKDINPPKANPDREALGTIIESHLDAQEGAVATVLVQTGTLRVGDLVVIGDVAGKIRALKDFRNEELKQALPGTPAKILGLRGVPEVGDILEVTFDKKLIKERGRKKTGARRTERIELGSLTTFKDEKKPVSFKIILKSDVLGSEEAIIESLAKLHHPEVGLEVVGRGLGNVTESDVLKAEATESVILAFKVQAPPNVKDLAQGKNTVVNRYEIIYDLINFVKEEMEKLLKPEILRTDLGKLKVLAIFRKMPRFCILGGKVTEGKLKKETKLRIIRDEREIGTGTLDELEINKRKVEQAESGAECGIKFTGKAEIREGDILECYIEEERKKTLEAG